MLNDPPDVPMDQTVDATWAEPSADPRTEPDAASPAAPVGAALTAALRTAAHSTASRVTVGGAESPFAFVVGAGRIAPDGASVEPPLDQLAAALALDSAAVTVVADPSAETAEALADASIDLEIALAHAEPLTAAWGEIMRIVPDDRADVRLASRLPAGGVDVDDEQWRVLAHIGQGRSVGELAPRLEVGHLAAMRSVHDLAVLGLVEVTAAPRLLPTPAPLAAPAPGAAPLAPPSFPPPGAAPTVGFAPPPPPPAAPGPVAPLAAEAPVVPDVAPAPVDEPDVLTNAQPAHAGDDGWTTVATAADGNWTYERLTPDADDWADAPAAPVSSVWDDAPVAAPPVDDWGAADTFDTTPTADLWADDAVDASAPTPRAHTAPVAPSAPTVAPPAEPVAPLVPARAVTPLPAYQRDEIPALPAEPAPAAATDEVLGSVVGEDELVNRALLFKFLSSMRD